MSHGGKVVTIKGDVERSHRHLGFLDAAQDLGQALGQRHPPAHDAYQSQVGDAVVLLDDFVGQSHQSTLNFRGGKNLRFLAKVSELAWGLYSCRSNHTQCASR